MAFMTFAQVPAIPVPPDGSGLVGWLLAGFAAVLAGIGGAVWVLLREQRTDFLTAMEKLATAHAATVKDLKDSCQKEMTDKDAAYIAQLKLVMDQMVGWRSESLQEQKQMRDLGQLFLTELAKVKLTRIASGEDTASADSGTRKRGGG